MFKKMRMWFDTKDCTYGYTLGYTDEELDTGLVDFITYTIAEEIGQVLNDDFELDDSLDYLMECGMWCGEIMGYDTGRWFKVIIDLIHHYVQVYD